MHQRRHFVQILDRLPAETNFKIYLQWMNAMLRQICSSVLQMPKLLKIQLIEPRGESVQEAHIFIQRCFKHQLYNHLLVVLLQLSVKRQRLL